MKPTPFSKNLIAGLLASCFLLVSCSPNEKVNEKPVNTSKAGDLALPNCTAEIFKLTDERAALVADIRTKAEVVLDAAQKENLQNLTNQLYKKSKDLYFKIRSIKSEGFAAEGCLMISPNAKTKVYKIITLQGEERVLAKKVSDITKKSNDILDNIRAPLALTKDIVFSAEMAEFLSDAKLVNGLQMIVAGKVVIGGADFIALKKDRNKTVCYSSSVDGNPFKKDTVANLKSVSALRLDDTSRSIVDLVLVVKTTYASRLIGLSCILADASDANDEVVDAFKSLLNFSGNSSAKALGANVE